MKKLGTLFGVDLYFDTDDEHEIALAEKYLKELTAPPKDELEEELNRTFPRRWWRMGI